MKEVEEGDEELQSGRGVNPVKNEKKGQQRQQNSTETYRTYYNDDVGW